MVRRKRPGRRPSRALGVAVFAVTVAFIVIGWLVGTSTDLSGRSFNGNQNAVWLEQAWITSPRKPTAYDQLATRLQREQIRFVYVHAGVLTPAGTLPAGSLVGAARLEQALRQRNASTKIVAWVGQEERAGGGKSANTIDLQNPAVRTAIASVAEQLVGPDGFDGVQYDIEPIVNGSASFLALLDATRSVIGAGKLLSVAAPMWAPTGWLAGGLRRVAGPQHALWSTGYYTAVARRVDQLAVMAYNTALPFGRLYTVAVKVQTQHIVTAVESSPHACQVFIGVPTYHDNGFWFHDGVENMANGINGVVAGLNSVPDHRGFAGLAIYRYGLTSQQDWKTYESTWLGDTR